MAFHRPLVVVAFLALPAAVDVERILHEGSRPARYVDALFFHPIASDQLFELFVAAAAARFFSDVEKAIALILLEAIGSHRAEGRWPAEKERSVWMNAEDLRTGAEDVGPGGSALIAMRARCAGGEGVAGENVHAHLAQQPCPVSVAAAKLDD